MATLTTNLFWGQGERNHRLEVIDGSWPDDIAGSVYVVGPDKREPGGHWFGAHGLIEKIDLRPDRRGRIAVRHRLVATPLARIRKRLPFLFRHVAFAELSPFGITNFANTNVEPIDDRLFVGYDAGRPIEIDPVTLAYVTPVGANDEWLQAVPAPVEPLIAVAAHPAADHEAGELWFVNYTQVAPPGAPKETWLVRWPLDGPLERWRIDGMSPFDSIHDVKVTEHHLVISDLPFVIEPGMLKGEPRTQRNQDHTKLWIIAKDDLEDTDPGGAVPAVEVRIPMPTGHLFVDHLEEDGAIRVVLQHIPLSDLMLSVQRGDVSAREGREIDPNHAGFIAQAVQPSVLGRYLIDPVSGEVLDAALAVDEQRSWGGILLANDRTTPAARARQRTAWFAAVGFDPDLVTTSWWDLYGDATDGVVAPEDLPETAIPGSLSGVDLESMKVTDVWMYAPGAFPSPPTYVPRVGATDPDDGYVVVVAHQDGPKEVQVFDAGNVGAGPIARASAPGFSPGLLLHSCWMAKRNGPRPSHYRIGFVRDIAGALRGMPRTLRSMARMGADLRNGR